ncbi:MAG: TadE/TadG family type IV pilus assembly protein [Actinomycetota bacterium]
MARRARGEKGAATVELALVLPVLLVLMAFVAPIVRGGYEYMVLQRAVSHGVRYATRVDVNPRSDGAGGLTRRPSVAEVRQFVVSAADPLQITTGQIQVTPNPRLALPGGQVEVTADYTIDYGVMADFVNAVKGTFFGGGAFVSEWDVTVSARGREE